VQEGAAVRDRSILFLSEGFTQQQRQEADGYVPRHEIASIANIAGEPMTARCAASVVLATVIALLDIAKADEPLPSGKCDYALDRDNVPGASRIVARPTAIAPVDTPCPPIKGPRRRPKRGCVVGLLRHWANCAPLAGVRLGVGSKTVQTDASGRYEACGLGANPLLVLGPDGAIYREVPSGVAAGAIIDLEGTLLRGIPLTETAVVTFEVDETLAGPPIASPATIYLQETPWQGPPLRMPVVVARPGLRLGSSYEIVVVRDPETGLLATETCWVSVVAPPPPPVRGDERDAGNDEPDASNDERDAGEPPTQGGARRSTCGHCGAANPSLSLLVVVLALLGRRRRRS
jgi:hypothetical protein